MKKRNSLNSVEVSSTRSPTTVTSWEIGSRQIGPTVSFVSATCGVRRRSSARTRATSSRGEKGLVIYVMAEIPSNIILAEQFAERFDGFSIGSNDLTQLTLGVDRDSETLAARFGANDPVVLTLIRDLITRAHVMGRPVGFCGQAPSNDPAYAQWLVDAGIDSVSVTPDSFVAVKQKVADAEDTPRGMG